MRLPLVLAGCGMLACVAPTGGAAQTFRGRVIDAADDRPVPTALVTLVDSSGEPRAMAIADSMGRYSVSAGGPGSYRLVAARIGFEEFRTPLLGVSTVEGVYPVDLIMRAAPVAIGGLTVEAQRIPEERVNRQLQLMIGLSLASLRNRPIGYDEIQEHLALGHDLADAIRWSNIAGLTVSYSPDGWCFSLRGRGCLPVYLNGLQLNRDFMEDVPLDMLHSIAVVSPTDGSLTYGAGAVLLYTAAWLR